MSQEAKVNKSISAKEVRVVAPDGKQLGIMSSKEALKKAEEFGLDLVEVAPMANPPVCRIMNYGKYKYEQSKKTHALRQHQRMMQVKEIKVRPHIDKHDLEHKIRRIREFLTDKYKVKVTVMFRGREITHMDYGRSMLEKISNEVASVCNLESSYKLEGNNMILFLTPK
ncbi:MAG: translation initiation factor IF-3 [Nitrospirota bacterium]